MTRNTQFASESAWLEQACGIINPYAVDFLPPEFKRNFQLAMDAQPTLVTNPNAGVPSWFTQYVDPEVIRVLQTPNLGAQILGEEKMGDWTLETAWFQMVENTGVTSSYGDFNDNAVSNVNTQWEERQSYLFQTHIEYGDLEVERAGLARLNLVAEKNRSAAMTLEKFRDYTYHFGVQGLANYGVLNDPSLSAPLTPTTKAYGGVKWVNNNQVVAAAQEIYADFQSLYNSLTSTTFGYIDMNTKFKLISPNSVNSALTAVNQFGITVRAFIKESFPSVEYISDPRYATAAGNVIQLIADDFDGSKTGVCAFNEKMRDHRLIPATSSYRQKKTAGTWGAVIKRPLAIAQIIGV
jgi:hypothetical protein